MPPTLHQAALKGLCPRCGSPGLFAGLADFAPRCQSCGLDFSSFNVGDGPAAFLTFAVGGLMVGLAMLLELTVRPPMWLHLLLWMPLTAGAVILSLRYAKAMLLALEYRNEAREGKRREADDE